MQDADWAAAWPQAALTLTSSADTNPRMLPLDIILAVVSQRGSACGATKKRAIAWVCLRGGPYSQSQSSILGEVASGPWNGAQGQGLGVSTQRGPPEGLHLGRSPGLPLRTTARALHARAVQSGLSKRRLGEGHGLQRSRDSSHPKPVSSPQRRGCSCGARGTFPRQALGVVSSEWCHLRQRVRTTDRRACTCVCTPLHACSHSPPPLSTRDG